MAHQVHLTVKSTKKLDVSIKVSIIQLPLLQPDRYFGSRLFHTLPHTRADTVTTGFWNERKDLSFCFTKKFFFVTQTHPTHPLSDFTFSPFMHIKTFLLMSCPLLRLATTSTPLTLLPFQYFP